MLVDKTSQVDNQEPPGDSTEAKPTPPHLKENEMNHEPSDPVERADQRRQSTGDGDVKIRPDGAVEQRAHGNMDETMVPKGKEHPDEGPYVPEHDHLDPDLEPESGDEPHVKKDSEA
ncbi:hypothetical protein [Paraburkholderia sp. SG-MS1]|uniref:hypothetical protein n=1 Tax=Paraburkholderia sp. SG-MS1 TaxID=2023741 RepID=UPI00406CE68C